MFTYFCVAFHLFIAGNRRHFKFGMIISCRSLWTTIYPWNRRGHVTWSTLNFKALNLPQEWLVIESSNFWNR